jgi:hypothetical protein
MKTVYHPIETKQKKWKIWNVAREKKGKLNYVIAVPKNVAMITNLKHGNINMGDFYGNFTCNLDFGSLSANKFFNSPVCITGKYSNCKINEVDVLKFSADFANVNVSTSDTLNIKSKYTKYKIGKSRSVKAKCSFGDINVGSVDNFDANLEHTPTTVENLGKKLNFECSFSGININNSSKQ